MQVIRIRTWIETVIMAFLATMALSGQAHAAGGRTPGAFAVSPTGAATYTIPIWAPPGPHGLQPSIALVYNSQSGGGPAGFGWSIAGLSSITRCTLTYAQDSAPAPVTLTYADRFCLDGQRLRLTSSENLTTYGGDLTTYQTEIANFSSVTAHGAMGQGPNTFTVQGKDGLTYEYGNGGNSQVLLNGTVTTWMLDQVTDRAGNTMVIGYAAPSANLVGVALPDTISWTPSAAGSTTYNYTMTFTYNPTNTVQRTGYVAGNSTLLSNELLGIVVKYGTTVVRNYVLHYTASSTTGRIELDKVTECADAAANNCLAATALTYQPGTAGAVSPASSTGSGTTNGVLKTADFNGDGKSDLLFATTNTDGTYQWWVQLATASGFGAPINTGASTPSAGNVLLDSFDGTAANEILAPNGTTWYVYKYDTASQSFTSSPTNATIVPGALYSSADVDGDGLPDLVYVKAMFDAKIQVQRNQTTGSTVSFAAVIPTSVAAPSCGAACVAQFAGNNQVQNSPVKKFDFDGDGRQDLILTITNSGAFSAYTLLSRGVAAFALNNVVSIVDSAESVVPVNWNDDACTDLVVGKIAYVSKCNGASATIVTLPTFPFMAIDWDGDGRTDLIVQTGGNYFLYQSTGTGVVSTNLYNFGIGGGTTVLDANGDGLDDVACSCGTNHALNYGLHNGVGLPPDLLISVNDGYDNSVSPTYVSMAQNNYSTYFNATYPDQPTYPDRPFAAPLFVVNQATFSDPSKVPGSTYQQTFWYYDAWVNLQGRGFEGFKQVGRYDARNKLWDTIGYAGAFPVSGVFAFDLTSWDQAGNQIVRYNWANVQNPALDSAANNQRYFVFYDGTMAQTYEAGDIKNGQLIATVATSYAYDNYNYGDLKTVTRTVTDKDSTSPYYNTVWTTTTSNTPAIDVDHWCLTLLTASQTTYTASNGETSVTRAKSFTPDTVKCRYDHAFTEPDSATYKVSEDLAYDAFGNLFTDTTTGVGMSARQTKVDWGTTGQFPMTVTDASGKQTLYDYDFSVGHVNKVTDPNGLKTSFVYGDGFGRVTQENKPDGTAVSTTYNACAPPNTCDPLWRTFVVRDFLDKNGNTLTTSVTTYDAADRPMEDSTLSLTGSWSTVIRNYDPLGYVASRTEPFFFGATQYRETYVYDALGRLTTSQRPISAANTSLQTTKYQYQGDTFILTDANQHAKTLVRDPNGWLRQTQDATGYAIKLGYDAAGSKTGVTDSLGNTLWSGAVQYGIAPFTVNSTDADLGAWTYTYDALGELTAWADAKSQHFSAGYDALSRMTDRYEPDLYTHWTWGTGAAVHEIGQLASVCTGTGANPTTCTAAPGYAESETYDTVGRLSQRSIQIPGDGTYTYSWAYNATTGLLDTLTYPTVNSYALQLQYAYQNGLLQSITNISDTPHVPFWTANATNPTGVPTQETLGNNVIVSHVLDAVTGWPSSITAGLNGGAGLQNNSYLFDYEGNLTQRQDNIAAVTENVYPDALNRLDHTVGDTNTQMSYDSMSRLSEWGTGSLGNVNDYVTPQSGCTYYANAQPHAVRKDTNGSHFATFCYDQNGNLTLSNTNYAAGDSTAAIWTSFNQPFQISHNTWNSSSTFSYDHNHQRWKQVATNGGVGETTIYIGRLLEKVTTSSGTVFRHYVPAGQNTVLYTRLGAAQGIYYYMTQDHLGSTAVITDSSGARLVTEKFAALGWNNNTAAEQTTIESITPHGFTGHEDMGNLSFVNMNGRIYDYSGSRFLSPDPTVSDPTNTLSYNRYAYVNYNPLTYADPTGFDPCGVVGNTVTVCGGGGGGLLGGGYAGGIPGNTGNAGNDANAESQAIDHYHDPQRIDPYLARAFNRAVAKSFQSAARPGFWARLRRIGLPTLAVMIVTTVVAPEGPGEALDATILAAEGGAAEAGAAGAVTIDASQILFSQSSVKGVDVIANSMKASGWVGAPVDVVATDAGLVTLDNTRVLAAALTDTPVLATIRGTSELLPESMAGRFVSSSGTEASTWGEALATRIGNQNATYQTLFPAGSSYIGVTP